MVKPKTIEQYDVSVAKECFDLFNKITDFLTQDRARYSEELCNPKAIPFELVPHGLPGIFLSKIDNSRMSKQACDALDKDHLEELKALWGEIQTLNIF